MKRRKMMNTMIKYRTVIGGNHLIVSDAHIFVVNVNSLMLFM